MIGSGVLTLSSTTALAPVGTDARPSRQGANAFSETLDQALKGERQSADSSNAEKPAGDSTAPSMQIGISQRGNVFAETKWNQSSEPATDDQRGEATNQAADSNLKSDTTEDIEVMPEIADDNESVSAKDRQRSGETQDAGSTENGRKASNGTIVANAETTETDRTGATENRTASATADTNGSVRQTDIGDTQRRARSEQSARTPGNAGNGSQSSDMHTVAVTSGIHSSGGQMRKSAEQVGAEATPDRTAKASSAAESKQDGALITRVDASNTSVNSRQPIALAKGGSLNERGAAMERSSQPRQAAEALAKTGGVDAERVARNSDNARITGTGAVRDVKTDYPTIPVASRPAAQVTGTAKTVPEISPADPTDGAETAAKAATETAPDTPAAADRASRPGARARADANGVAQPNAVDKPVMTLSGIQSVPAAATGAGTGPASQIAAAVSRDLEELAPSRLSLSTAGSPKRPLKSIQLQLNPAELGPVNIRLQSVGGELRISIRAENDQTAQMLSRDSDAIRSALRAAGISGPEITVSVNRTDSGTQPQNTAQNRDAFGQQSGGHENRENMPNESRQSNRDPNTRNTTGSPVSRDDLEPRGGNGNDRVFI